MSQSSSRFAVAIHVLLLLAEREGEGPISSDFIACSVGSHPVLIRRLLGDLKLAGIVAATRGKEGGFALGRPPTAIQLGAVLRAIEPGDLFALHAHPNEHCPVGSRIPKLLGMIFSGCKGVVTNHLNETNLADLTGSSRCEDRRAAH